MHLIFAGNLYLFLLTLLSKFDGLSDSRYLSYFASVMVKESHLLMILL
jgi:hypothetical protein